MDKNKVFIYDIESYPNFFSCAYYATGKDKYGYVEISPRQNDFSKFISILHTLHKNEWVMCGFNNYDFDWTVTNWIWDNADKLKKLSGEAIALKINEFVEYWFNVLQKDRFAFFEFRKKNKLFPNSLKLPQLDLFKIHRLDAAKIGLKVVQFNMQFPSIQVLPHKPGTYLTFDQMEDIKTYNINNDVAGTKMFYDKSSDQINFRVAMKDLLGKNFMTASDVKIAEEWFKKELETRYSEQGDTFEPYQYDEDGERKVIQTTYPDGFYMDDVIFDCISFKTPVFNSILNWFKQQLILDTEGVFRDLDKDRVRDLLPFASKSSIDKSGGMKKLELIYAGIPFVFGLGGIHASVESTYVNSDDDYVLLDVDVKSMYPSIIAATWEVNGKYFKVCPRHIGEIFCEIVEYVRDIRFKTPKSDPKNLMYKLILNAFTFGKLNEPASFVYDPKTAMTITINGQLMLCMLAESIFENTNDVSIIQANTDGLTLKVKKEELDKVVSIYKAWEVKTGLILEEARYKFMAISNVNNYIAKYSMDSCNEKPGKLKVKGQYLTEPSITQDHSNLVITKAVLEYFKSGVQPEDFIKNHSNPYDFRARVNVDRRFSLIGVKDENEHDISFKQYTAKDKAKYDTHEKIVSLPDKFSISERLVFQRMIRKKGINIIDVINKFNDQDEFIQYIRNTKAAEKKISFDEVDDKVVNRALKSPVMKSQFIGEKLAKLYNVELKVGEAFARWYFDRGESIDMNPIKVKKLSKVTAFYVAKDGFYMYKETLPTEEKPTTGRFTGVVAGSKVMDCNDMSTFNLDNINHQWYIDEAWKLIKPIMQKDKG